MTRRLFLILFLTSTIAFVARAQDFDVIIKNGAVYDGAGTEAQNVDLAIKADRITGLGDYSKAEERLGWTPSSTFQSLVREMVDADLSHYSRSENLRRETRV